MEKEKQSPLVPILILFIIILAFISGTLWQKIKTFEKDQGSVAGTQQQPKENFLSLANLKKYAQELKLDTKKFNQCLDNNEKKAQVEKEINEAINEGVGATPTFFLNGYLISGAIPFDMFKTLIDYELSFGFASGKKPTEDVQKLISQGVIKIEQKKEVKIEDNYPSQGPANAKITLVEYSDFECPFCATVYPTVKKIMESYSNNIRFIYKQFPLTSIHPNAQKAAEASLCALDQGKFWEYHDKLFESASAAK